MGTMMLLIGGGLIFALITFFICEGIVKFAKGIKKKSTLLP